MDQCKMALVTKRFVLCWTPFIGIGQLGRYTFFVMIVMRMWPIISTVTNFYHVHTTFDPVVSSQRRDALTQIWRWGAGSTWLSTRMLLTMKQPLPRKLVPFQHASQKSPWNSPREERKPLEIKLILSRIQEKKAGHEISCFPERW